MEKCNNKVAFLLNEKKDFTYCCETAFNISLHLQVNRFGHIYFAVLGVSVKY